MHKFRTHHCNALSADHINQTVKLSGWVHRRRDHGNLLFIDLRDHYGITQLVFTDKNLTLKNEASYLRYESVITIKGTVLARSNDTINNTIDTGAIEVAIDSYSIESDSSILPITVNAEQEYPDSIRLKYRFLDLRRAILHNNIILRSKIIREIRELLQQEDFLEIQTPILAASSPEGARDFLVPSRVHPGKFYALPQAPQQFKQILMMSSFDKYFQIAPCFRDEDARADRSPGEFYQLDMEMAFVEQNDIFNIMEPLLYKIFDKFGKKDVSKPPFTRITYKDAMSKYGTDKPDTRNPLQIVDATTIFQDSNFTLFKQSIAKGAIVKAIPAPITSGKSRKFFDEMIKFAINEGFGGLAYIQFDENNKAKGPIAKFLSAEQLDSLQILAKLQPGDSVFFSCGKASEAMKLAGKVRTKLGTDLELINNNKFEFCWIVDFPFYELNDETQQIEFSHNPFSMPQGGMQALQNATTQEELLDIKAFQYDIVCNGIELSSGAIRNHKLDVMYKAFEIAGYNKEQVSEEFGGMIKAFQYGAPPHGGIAPGIDRMVMLIADTTNIRDVIAFPMNQQAEDLLMEAPNYVDDKQLRDLNIMLSPSARIKKDNIDSPNKNKESA